MVSAAPSVDVDAEKEGFAYCGDWGYTVGKIVGTATSGQTFMQGYPCATVIRVEAMDALIAALGEVDAEWFISMVSRE